MVPQTMTSSEVYLLPLKDDGSPDVGGNQYIYLAPTSDDPIVVRFAIEGTSSVCRHGSLWVNIPEEGAEFHRGQFREFKYVLRELARALHLLSLQSPTPSLQSSHASNVANGTPSDNPGSSPTFSAPSTSPSPSTIPAPSPST